MTIGDLKKLFEGMDDDTKVVVQEHGDEYSDANAWKTMVTKDPSEGIACYRDTLTEGDVGSIEVVVIT